MLPNCINLQVVPTSNPLSMVMDGIVTTFAVVAGAAGADLGSAVILILGFSSLFADGLSMGLGDFLSETAEHKYIASEMAREIWEFENYPEGEKKEMVDLYEEKGFSHEDAVRMVEILSKNKDHFIDKMMVEELGLMPVDPNESPAKHGLVTFISFFINGLIPLLTFVVGAIISSVSQKQVNFKVLFAVNCVLTAITMFALGAVSSIFSIDPWWKSGLWTLANGVVVAGASYFIGWIVNVIVIAMGLPPVV